MRDQFKKRLFIALNLPKNIREEITGLIVKLAKDNKRAPIKWVGRDNFHLTLHFLGHLGCRQEEQIKLAMQSLSGKFGSLQFLLGKINGFPNIKNPRIIFLECNPVGSKLVFKLQKLLGEKLQQIGLDIDKRSWKSHITLGRVKEKRNLKIGDYVINPSVFFINTFDLMESKLTPTGAEYKIVEKFNMSKSV